MVFDGPLVDRPIILYRSQFPILFLDKEEGCSVEAFGDSYGASFSVFFDELVKFLHFWLGQVDVSAD